MFKYRKGKMHNKTIVRKLNKLFKNHYNKPYTTKNYEINNQEIPMQWENSKIYTYDEILFILEINRFKLIKEYETLSFFWRVKSKADKKKGSKMFRDIKYYLGLIALMEQARDQARKVLTKRISIEWNRIENLKLHCDTTWKDRIIQHFQNKKTTKRKKAQVEAKLEKIRSRLENIQQNKYNQGKWNDSKRKETNNPKLSGKIEEKNLDKVNKNSKELCEETIERNKDENQEGNKFKKQQKTDVKEDQSEKVIKNESHDKFYESHNKADETHDKSPKIKLSNETQNNTDKKEKAPKSFKLFLNEFEDLLEETNQVLELTETVPDLTEGDEIEKKSHDIEIILSEYIITLRKIINMATISGNVEKKFQIVFHGCTSNVQRDDVQLKYKKTFQIFWKKTNEEIAKLLSYKKLQEILFEFFDLNMIKLKTIDNMMETLKNIYDSLSIHFKIEDLDNKQKELELLKNTPHKIKIIQEKLQNIPEKVKKFQITLRYFQKVRTSKVINMKEIAEFQEILKDDVAREDMKQLQEVFENFESKQELKNLKIPNKNTIKKQSETLKHENAEEKSEASKISNKEKELEFKKCDENQKENIKKNQMSKAQKFDEHAYRECVRLENILIEKAKIPRDLLLEFVKMDKFLKIYKQKPEKLIKKFEDVLNTAKKCKVILYKSQVECDGNIPSGEYENILRLIKKFQQYSKIIQKIPDKVYKKTEVKIVKPTQRFNKPLNLEKMQAEIIRIQETRLNYSAAQNKSDEAEGVQKVCDSDEESLKSKLEDDINKKLGGSKGPFKWKPTKNVLWGWEHKTSRKSWKDYVKSTNQLEAKNMIDNTQECENLHSKTISDVEKNIYECDINTNREQHCSNSSENKSEFTTKKSQIFSITEEYDLLNINEYNPSNIDEYDSSNIDESDSSNIDEYDSANSAEIDECDSANFYECETPDNAFSPDIEDEYNPVNDNNNKVKNDQGNSKQKCKKTVKLQTSDKEMPKCKKAIERKIKEFKKKAKNGSAGNEMKKKMDLKEDKEDLKDEFTSKQKNKWVKNKNRKRKCKVVKRKVNKTSVSVGSSNSGTVPTFTKKKKRS